MTRRTTAFVAAALSALLLVGCGSGEASQDKTPSPLTEKSAAFTPAQAESFATELRGIDPALDTQLAMQNAVQMCRMLSRDLPEEVQRKHASRIFYRAPDPAAAGGAPDKIIQAIKTNGFCPT